MPKVILISQIPLPYSKIGSWTTLYYNYLNSHHTIDYIICEQPNSLFNGVEYQVVPDTLLLKIKKKYYKNRYLGYLQALEKILINEEKCIIQIIDNFGIIKPLQDFLKRTNRSNQCYVQFFYHGFAPFYENFSSRNFYEFIDEMVLLTQASYLVHKDYYTVLPCQFSVLHNGIDTAKFYKVEHEKKVALRENLGVADKKVFIWCSQDRPKKGLDFILDVWKRVYASRKDIVLLVVGATREDDIEGVLFFGKIPNDQLPEYYQAADCYLFPTLCHEGFGMSLIEALYSGCYCIASNLGGVPEVLQYGELGKLIEAPHFVGKWKEAIESFLMQNPKNRNFPENLYSMEAWNIGMNRIIENAKKSL